MELAVETIRWSGDTVTVRYHSDNREEQVTRRAALGLMSRGLAYIVQADPEPIVVHSDPDLAPEPEPPAKPARVSGKVTTSVLSGRKAAPVENEPQFKNG